MIVALRLRRLGASLVLPVVLVVAYQVYAIHRHLLYFPTVGVIARSFVHTWNWSGLRLNAWPSLENMAIGYAVGMVAALVVGVVVAQSWLLRTAFEPVISFFLALPAVALLPVFLIMFGVGSRMHQILIAQAVFFQVMINTVDGLSGVDEGLLETSRVFRVKGWRKLLFVTLPAAAPQILGGARVALSISVLVTIVSELQGSIHGIGVVVLDAQDNFDSPVMWAGMVFMAILGIALNYLFGFLERPILRRSGLLSTSND